METSWISQKNKGQTSLKIPSLGTSTQHISNIEKVRILDSYFPSNMFDWVTEILGQLWDKTSQIFDEILGHTSLKSTLSLISGNWVYTYWGPDAP